MPRSKKTGPSLPSPPTPQKTGVANQIAALTLIATGAGVILVMLGMQSADSLRVGGMEARLAQAEKTIKDLEDQLEKVETSLRATDENVSSNIARLDAQARDLLNLAEVDTVLARQLDSQGARVDSLADSQLDQAGDILSLSKLVTTSSNILHAVGEVAAQRKNAGHTEWMKRHIMDPANEEGPTRMLGSALSSFVDSLQEESAVVQN